MNLDKTAAYYIALNRIPGVGARVARHLIAQLGSAEAVFSASMKDLRNVDSIGNKLAQNIIDYRCLDIGLRELDFITRSNIELISWFDKQYPTRLKQCHDAPIILFSKGNIDWNAQRIVSIVGTRRATNYGLACTEKLIAEMGAKGNYIVVSGLAYGIDTIAHRACLLHNVPTWAVLAHGLDKIYPIKHRDVAKSMLEFGGLITEFSSGTAMQATNFLSRNRIVAGLSDCTIVVESAAKGGSLVTADIASSYNRDVFAFAGRSTDKYSEGCNMLIRDNKACLIQNLNDVEKAMNWDVTAKQPQQRQLFIELSEQEKQLLSHLSSEPIFIDLLANQSRQPVSKLLSLLFELEMKGVVRSHVGKQYSLI